MAADSVNREMVCAMVKLARTLDFQVVAEQVEDPASFETLRELGVDFVQGYFVEAPSKPATASSTGSYRTLKH